jgi:hypothetical protein
VLGEKYAEVFDGFVDYVKNAARVSKRNNPANEGYGMDDSLITEYKKEERFAIARNALHMGMTIADTSRLTGLTEDEIRKLAQ